mmetsp:Transcript_12361/g.28277  ORF Transcript_12361/g.28277 Transcript_12361/m.28277 type:complete len:122 (-) Transcript_12361:404-769(-)
MQFCDEGLVFTDSVIVEAPIALPVRPEIASGLSYWIFRAEKYHGVSIANSAKEYVEKYGPPKCESELSNLGGIEEVDDLTPLSPENMVFPNFLQRVRSLRDLSSCHRRTKPQENWQAHASR